MECDCVSRKGTVLGAALPKPQDAANASPCPLALAACGHGGHCIHTTLFKIPSNHSVNVS